jgi:hypothetical protein
MPAADFPQAMPQFVPSQPLFAQHGLYPSPAGWILLCLFFMGPYILAGIFFVVGVLALFWSRPASGICLLLAAVWLLVGYGVWSNEWQPAICLWCEGLAGIVSFFVTVVVFQWYARTAPAHKQRAHWAAAVARNPEVLEATGLSRDQDFRLLEKTTRLKQLSISGCLLTGNQLRYLEGLERLQNLRLNNTLVDDAGLRHVAKLIELRELDLSDNYNIGGAGLHHLNTLMHLRELNLSRCCNLTDTAIENVATLTQLRGLHLTGCRKITDRGLEHLGALTGLETLRLIRTSATREGIQKLQQALPKCNIEW